MNLKSLEYFLMVVEEMNITRAAERLYISQQALSSHIKRLEDEFGAELFRRKPFLSLTMEGEKLAYHGRRMLEIDRYVHADISALSTSGSSKLSIGISRLRANAFFPMIWESFHSKYPHISIDLVDGNSATLQNLLETGRVDLYIGIKSADHPNQKYITLSNEPLICCMSHAFLTSYYPDTWQEMLQRFCGGVEIADIAQMPLITLRQKNSLRRQFDLELAIYGAVPRIVFETESSNLIYQIVKQGSGVGVVSPVVLYQNADEIRKLGDQFHYYPILTKSHFNEIILTFREDYPQSQFFTYLIETIQEVFAGKSSTLFPDISKGQ